MQVIDLRRLKENYKQKFPKSTVSSILSSCPNEIGAVEFLAIAGILLRVADISQGIDE